MTCPWRRHRRAAIQAHRETKQAEAEQHASEFRNEAAKHQARRSRAVSAELRNEIDKNHWTELLVQSMQRGN